MSIDYRGNPWDVSGVVTNDMYDLSCVNTPPFCEASCAAFDSTFPTTPAGYSIANPSGTTPSGLGVRRCADGYCGVAEVACGSGGAFEAPSGCVENLDPCTAFSTTFPTTPAGYTIANPTSTTVAGLGAIGCVLGGTAAIVCQCSGTFSAPTGCILPITDANIWTAVEECQAESAAFDCPASQATYGPIEDWDVGAVTSLNTWGAGCTEDAEWKCGRASWIRFDAASMVSILFASDSASAVGSVLPVLGLQQGPLAVGCEQRHQHEIWCGRLSALLVSTLCLPDALLVSQRSTTPPPSIPTCRAGTSAPSPT